MLVAKKWQLKLLVNEPSMDSTYIVSRCVSLLANNTDQHVSRQWLSSSFD